MQKFSLRYLYQFLGKAIRSDLPFQITDRRKVVAVVVKPKDIEGEFSLDPIIIVKSNGKLFRYYVDRKKSMEVFNSKKNQWEKYESKK